MANHSWFSSLHLAVSHKIACNNLTIIYQSCKSPKGHVTYPKCPATKRYKPFYYHSMVEIKDRFEVFEADLYDLSNEQWRELFTLLNLQVVVHDKDVVGNEHEFTVKQRPLCERCESSKTETYCIPNLFPYCEIRLGLYLRDGEEYRIEKETTDKAVQIVCNEHGDVYMVLRTRFYYNSK